MCRFLHTHYTLYRFRALGSQTTGMEKEFKMDKSILSRQKSRTLQHNMKKKPKNLNSNTLKCSIQ